MVLMRIKRLFKWDYPKLNLLAIAIIAAYLVFSNREVQGLIDSLNSFSYFGIFIAGMFFTFGFTSPFSAGFFIVANPGNTLLAAILGGLGAMISDLAIFSFIRFSFMDEFEKLKKTKLLKELSYLMEKYLGHRIKLYLMYAFVGILIASPMPDEAGVIMLAGLTKINTYILAAISFVMNTLGILVLLLI